ncbi:MAG: MIP family channel protein [Desulfobulbaceae bacterium]|nr:MIP family channel protein [Desulfobulbaceae bacterium]
MRYTAFFVGEFLGTFILVFFGCGSVAVTVLFGAHVGLFQVALLWGLSVTLAIYATRHLSCAHLNPAVSIAMVIGNRMVLRKLPVYICAQLSGAFLAASVLYLLFSASIAQYELSNAIVRGSAESIQTAMIFGEFYPNPGSGTNVVVSMTTAALAEAIGTFALVFFIFAITEGCNLGRPNDILAPIFIGLALAVIISIIAPLTQAGLNPARDFGPRMFAVLAGWGRAALPDDNYGFLVVYILAPVAGGSVASLFFTRFLEPLMVKKSCKCA